MWARRFVVRTSQCLNSGGGIFGSKCHIRPNSGIVSKVAPESFAPYREGENSYAINYLETLPEYRNSIFDSAPLQTPGKWDTFKPVVQNVKIESSNPDNPLTSTSPVDFISAVIKEKSTFSDEELMAVLYALRLFQLRPFPKFDTAYKTLWEALDQECVARSTGWSIDKLLIFDDLLFRLNSISLSNFHWQLVKKLFRKCNRLTKEQFIRFMFCLNVGRKVPTVFTTYELEHKLIEISPSLSPEEISLVALGFFKTETKIRDDNLVKQLLENVMPAASTLNRYFVSAVAKLARFCGRSGNGSTLYEFQDRFYPELYRLDLTECVHLGLVGTNASVKHEKLLAAVRDKAESNLDSARLKEIERILLALTMFNVDCESLCRKVVEQLRTPSPSRKAEYEAYGRCIPSIVYYATIQNVIAPDLINKVLDPEFLRTYYGKNSYKYQREMLCLDLTTAIECPDYNGHRLTQRERNSVTKFNMMFINPAGHEKVTEYQSILRSVASHTTEILGGEKFTYLMSALPQFHTAEILYCMDENNHPVPVPETLRQKVEFEVKWIPKDDPAFKNVTFHLILVCQRNACIFGENTPKGQTVLQLRQLEKMGYKAHTVFGVEWDGLTESKRRELVQDLIYGSDSNSTERNIATNS